MDILGIGPLELLFILVIALIVLGPRDIARFARSAGKALNRIYRSEAWGAINKASREFRDLPNKLAREAALDDLDESIRNAGKTKSSDQEREDNLNAWKPSPKGSRVVEEDSASIEPEPTNEAASTPSDDDETKAETGSAQGD